MKNLLVLLFAVCITESSSSQGKVTWQLTSTDNVHFLLTDPLGRKTGRDPRGSTNRELGFEIKEIPQSEYAFEGPGDSPDDTITQHKNPEYHVLMYFCDSPQNDGVYTISAIGITTCQFDFYAGVNPNDGSNSNRQSCNFKVENVPIEADSVITYRFTYNGAPGTAVSFVKVISTTSILQDISVMRKLNWISDQTTVDKYSGLLDTYSSQIKQSNFTGARSTLGTILQNIVTDSSHTLTANACNSLRPDVQQLLNQLPSPPPGLAVTLINSGGTALTGGSLQYYEGSWKDAINNNDGTFSVNSSLSTVSLRMTYAYGSQTKSNVPVNGGSVTFQTVSTQVKLQNSQGTLMDQGTVQYYAGAWRDFGTTTNGVATKELLPASYSFRMTYAYGSNNKQQDIGSNPTVVYQTVNAAVQLKNSQGTLMDAGAVQYYAGAWRDFGSTINGVATKELLPANYSFRMTYAFASKDMQQNIGTNPTVVFNTVNAAVQLKNSQGNLIDAGTVQYYAGAWRAFGTTTNGSATKELLANNYSFRMTYEYVSNDKAQDVGTISTVGFSTVLCTVRVSNTQGQLVSGATVSYYSGAWRQIGPTVNGQITKELLPANLSFRATYGGRSQDKAQNLSTNAVVEIVLP